MLVPNRHEASESYRYGFNGMEKDDELKGEGNSIDFGSRIYDPRVGRWFATDPMEVKYPSITPYHFAANSPIMYYDLDGEDIVYFNRNGKEIYRVVSDKVNETWVIRNTFSTQKFGSVLKNKDAWAKAKMPNMIINVSTYERSLGRDYNKYDYQIAASTHLLNEKLRSESLPEKMPSTGHPTNAIELLDPNIVKSVLLKETNYGYTTTPDWKNGGSDVMQVNVGSDPRAGKRTDWDNNKPRFAGLSKDKVPTPSESINSGVLWLYYKGIKVVNIKYKNKEIVGGDVSWVGGNDWLKAVEKYNGGGDSNYLEKFNAILGALKQNSSTEYVKELKEKAEREKKKNTKLKL